MTGGGQSKQKLKKAKKLKALSAEAKASQEQRVGKSPHLKKSTPIARPKPKPRALNETEKRVRALNKRLREIEALRQRETDGETLDAQQMAKLDTLDEVLEELAGLVGV